MDNNLPTPTNNPTGNLFRSPRPPVNPVPQQGPPGLLSRIRSRKKLFLIIAAIIILLTVLLYLSFSAIKNRFFPDSSTSTPQSNTPSLIESTSMRIKAEKNTFSVSEKIPVSVVASSDGKVVTAFDTLIEYDSQFLTLSAQNKPPLEDFKYFGKNSDTLISVSAVQKPDSTSSIKFDNTTLFELEFTPKKPGKTILKLIYMPGSLNDSNLLDGGSKDILGSGSGIEITIN